MSDKSESESPVESSVDPWEEEATRTFGPPKVRAEKNRRYVARLVRKHSEQTIRDLLKALSHKGGLCFERLARHALDSVPLHEIIRPYELLGLHLRVKVVSDTQLMVDIGEGHGEIGSGGKFLMERTELGHYRTVSGQLWIA